MTEAAEETAINEAVRRVGSQSALARKVGVSPQAVQKWCAEGEVPLNRVPDVARVSGVSKARLAPSMYAEEVRLPQVASTGTQPKEVSHV